MATRAELEAGLREALEIDDLDLAEQFGAALQALPKELPQPPMVIDSTSMAVGGMKGIKHDLLNLDPQTQTLGDAAKEAVRTFSRRMPGVDYALAAGRYVEDKIAGKPTTYREALDHERLQQGMIAENDKGMVAYGPEAYLAAKLPFTKGKGAAKTLVRSLQAGGYAGASEATRGASKEKIAKEALLAAGGTSLAEGGIAGAGTIYKYLRKSGARHALKGTQANERDVAMLRDRLGGPEDAGEVALGLQTPTGEPVLPAFASPETRYQNLLQSRETIGPLKTALVEKAPGEINVNRLEQSIDKRLASRDTRAVRTANGGVVPEQKKGRALLKTFKAEYNKDPQVVATAHPVDGATVNGGRDLSMPQGEEFAERTLPKARDGLATAQAELDDAARASSEADAAALRLKKTEARDANMELDNASTLSAAQIGADTRRRVTQQAQDRARVAAQNASSAQQSVDAIEGVNPQGVYLRQSDTLPHTQQAHAEIRQADATATAADRNLTNVRNRADPLERLDDGRTEVHIRDPETGAERTHAFEAGGESNIGRARRGAEMAEDHAAAVEEAAAPRTDPTTYTTDDVAHEAGLRQTNERFQRTRPQHPTARARAYPEGDGPMVVIDRSDPMSIADADALYQELTDDVYRTASNRYPSKGPEAIEMDPELRLKRDVARQIRDEIDATLNQMEPGAAGPLTAEGQRYKMLRRNYEEIKSFEPILESAANRHAAVQDEISPWSIRHLALPVLGGSLGASHGPAGIATGAIAGLGAEVGAKAARTYGHPSLARGYRAIADKLSLVDDLDPTLPARIAALRYGRE